MRALPLPAQTAARGPARPLLAGLLSAALLALSSAPAHALFGDDEARRAIIDLRSRVELQSRDFNTRLTELNTQIGARLDALTQRLDRLEQSARGQFELQNQIEQLRQETARLRGQLEVQTNELAQTQRRQKDAMAEIDARVKPFEPVSVQIDGKTVSVEPEERRTYEAAMTALRAGDFATAQAGFSALRLRWPASAYGPGALYWTGNAQYAQKDCKAAMGTQQQFITRHTDHPKVPDALLTIGLCQIETGDKRGARKTLESVIDKHAGTPAAAQAKERLATLK
ncbi:MAG: tol-pal system protein YbgF [Burkholderiales bacterium]